MGSIGRQTVLPEYAGAFPYYRTRHTGEKTHIVHETDRNQSAGTTKCSRWDTHCDEIVTEVDALSVAKNLCAMCACRLEQNELRTLALMASAASQHEYEADDIQP